MAPCGETCKRGNWRCLRLPAPVVIRAVFHRSEHVLLLYGLVHLSFTSKQLAFNLKRKNFNGTIMELSKGSTELSFTRF